MGVIRVGVAGWDYADWEGIVYPVGATRRLDRLVWISRFVDVIEINSSFYRPVAPRIADSWVRRTRDREGFLFTAKSHRSWTHGPPEGLEQSVSATLDGLEPLREAGRLGALLIQFPQSFRLNEKSTEHIERLTARLAGWPAVVEVRHASWEAEATADWFAKRGLGWCLVDQPCIGKTTARPLPRVTAPTAYLRLHGRNTADWFRPDAGRDARYDYRYSVEQLRGLASAAEQMAERAESLFVIQNNHFRGQALANALQMKWLLEGRRPTAPAQLVDRYPDLGPHVSIEDRRLF